MKDFIKNTIGMKDKRASFIETCKRIVKNNGKCDMNTVCNNCPGSMNYNDRMCSVNGFIFEDSREYHMIQKLPEEQYNKIENKRRFESAEEFLNAANVSLDGQLLLDL